MELRGLHAVLDNALREYATRDGDLYIRLVDLLRVLEATFRGTVFADIDTSARHERFNQYLASLELSLAKQSPSYFVLRTIDDYFALSVQYYGFDVLRARQFQRNFGPATAFEHGNSATIYQVLDPGYRDNLLRCSECWREVSVKLRRLAMDYVLGSDPTEQ